MMHLLLTQNTCSFISVAEERRSYQVLDKKHFQDGRRHSGGPDVWKTSLNESVLKIQRIVW